MASIIVDQANKGQVPLSMMAWRVHEFGPPSVMRFERLPLPTVGENEVLVKVAAAGVGPWDGWIRSWKKWAAATCCPSPWASDVSGEVVAVGPGVSSLSVGDQMYGVTNSQFLGGYAEYALASATMISNKPTSLTYVEAASVPVVAVTAWQALFDQAQLKAGQKVLIHGAAGNVGAYAVQLAHQARMQIIATALGEDIPRVRELGANTAIDFQTQNFEAEARDVDAVIDLIGGDVQQRSFPGPPSGRQVGFPHGVTSRSEPCAKPRYRSGILSGPGHEPASE